MRLTDQFRAPTLLFSGGKDSLAALLMLRAHWDDITVAWANPGAPDPAALAYIERIAQRVPHFVELRGDQPGWIERNGWPADIVPVRATQVLHGAEPAAVRFAPYTQCCDANMWEPIRRYMADSGCTLCITGQRRAEKLRNRTRDEEFNEIDGIVFWNILNDWTDDQVFGFLRERAEPLPPGYERGARSSSDCWNCTAYLDHNAPRLQALRRDDPTRWEIVRPVLSELALRIEAETRPLFDLVGA